MRGSVQVDLFSLATRGTKMYPTKNKNSMEEPHSLTAAKFRKAESPPAQEGTRKKVRTSRIKTVVSVHEPEYIPPVPRFLMIRREVVGDEETVDFSKVNPFLIARAISLRIKASPKSTRKVNGGLLVETSSDVQTQRLLELKKIGDLSVVVSPHERLNNSQGVVVCADLLNCTEKEIEEEMRCSGVIHCRRLTAVKDGVRRSLPTHVLTFDRPIIPEYVIAGIHRLSVRPFVPSPMRCFRCQRYGHTATRCKREPLCACGQQVHEDSECGPNPVCVNCGGAHSAKSRNCPMYKLEVQIQELKIKKNISYTEAKRLIPHSAAVSPGHSYATVAAKGSESSIPQELDLDKLTPLFESLIARLMSKYELVPKDQNAIPSTSGLPKSQTLASQSRGASPHSSFPPSSTPFTPPSPILPTPKSSTAALVKKLLPPPPPKPVPGENDTSDGSASGSQDFSDEPKKKKKGRGRPFGWRKYPLAETPTPSPNDNDTTMEQ